MVNLNIFSHGFKASLDSSLLFPFRRELNLYINLKWADEAFAKIFLLNNYNDMM